MRVLAADIAGFVTGESARIAEVDRMTPLTDRSAGRFQSPLSEPRWDVGIPVRGYLVFGRE